MPNSLMTLPLELREQILLPIVKPEEAGTIKLQYPLWGDKTVFVPPVMQVCKELRQNAIQVFYRANVFMWILDPEAHDHVDPATFPLQPSDCGEKDYGPHGPLVSSLPWQYPDMLSNLRYLRLNLYLPPQHDVQVWSNKFTKQLSGLVNAVDRGHRLKDFKVLVGTWHKVRELGEPQAAALRTLEAMQVRGLVQVRTRSLDAEGKAVVQELDLERGMRADGSGRLGSLDAAGLGVKHLDWEWEGGAAVPVVS